MAPGDSRQIHTPCQSAEQGKAPDTEYGSGAWPSPRQRGPKVLGELNTRDTTRAETWEKEQGWHEDQKKTGQSKKESKTEARAGLWLSSLPGKGKFGPRVRGVAEPVFRGQIVQLWQRGSGRV